MPNRSFNFLDIFIKNNQSNKTMKYSIEEMKKWVELEEMKDKIRKVFASDSETYKIHGDDIKAIYKIIFKDKNKS